MILEDIRYYQPTTAGEAIDAYREASDEGLSVHYLGGGTEITTHARDGKLAPGALIDLKRLPETTDVSRSDGHLRFGSSLTLTAVADGGDLPLLSAAACRIADRTIRNSITLGGNIAGMLPYREAVLPFLILDGTFEIIGPGGERTVPSNDVFDRRLKLDAGEFLAAAAIPETAAAAPWYYERREKDSRVDYPLVTLAAAVVNGEVRFAISGAFLAPVVVTVPGGVAVPAEATKAAVSAVSALGTKYRSDARGGAGYRQALTERAIGNATEALHKETQ